jgi:hypothetical protein
MKVRARLATNTVNSVTLWDHLGPSHRAYVRLEVIADGQATVLFIDRNQWENFAKKAGPTPQMDEPGRAVVRLRWTEDRTPNDVTLDLPVDPHSEKSTVKVGRRLVTVNVCGVAQDSPPADPDE